MNFSPFGQCARVNAQGLRIVLLKGSYGATLRQFLVSSHDLPKGP